MMEKRLVSELVSIYKHERNTKDIYVEGVLDRNVVKFFLEHCGSFDVNISSIDVLDIDDEFVRRYGFVSAENNKGKVVSLACYLYEIDNDFVSNVLCIVDKDFDFFLDLSYDTKILLYYDYAALELYFYDVCYIEKMSKLVFGLTELGAATVIESITPVLEDIFFIRAANEKLKYGLEALPINKYLSITGVMLVFERDSYIHNYLNKNAMLHKKDEFVEVVEELGKRKTSDPRNQIRGHDFFSVIAHFFYLVKNKKQKIEEQHVCDIFMGMVSFEKLEEEALFRRMLEFCPS